MAACASRPRQWQSLQQETGLIQKGTEFLIGQKTTYLTERIPMEAANPAEGVDPRELVVYHFNAQDHVNYIPIGMGATSESYQMAVNGNGGPRTLDVTGNAADSRLCDLPRGKIVAGVEVYSSTYAATAYETDVVCLDTLSRADRLEPYIQGLRKALPREGKIAHEKNLLKQVIGFSRSNGAVTRNPNLTLGTGSFPAVPTLVVDIGYLKQHAAALKGMGWMGMVEYGVSDELLRAMIEGHKASYPGAQIMLTPYKDDISPNFGQRYVYEGLLFRILEVPTRGYIKRTGLTSEFVEWDPHTLVAGSDGVIAEYDATFNNPYVTVNGTSHPLVELIVFAAPQSLARRPYARQASSLESMVNEAGRFSMGVHLVKGAHIKECNELETKFKFLMTHAYQLAPYNNRLFGSIASLFKPFTRQYNEAPAPWCDAETLHVVSGPRGVNPPNNACCDVAELTGTPGFDPDAPMPILPTADVPNPVNVAGKFWPDCDIVVAGGATSIRVPVDRRDGSLGAASLAYTTTPDTALAGTDYTTTAGTLNWADGEGGVKLTAPIPILPGSLGNVAFSVTFSAPTGAAYAVGSYRETCIKIPEPCEDTDEIACPPGAGVPV